MKSQLLEITSNYRICAHPKLNPGELHTVHMVVDYDLGNIVWQSYKPLFPQLPTPNLILNPKAPAWGRYKPLCIGRIRAMVTYYLGSSYGGTVTSGPQPQPSPPQSWKREYRSSTFNRNKGCSHRYRNGKVKVSKSTTYLGSSIYSQPGPLWRVNGLRKDSVPLALPLSGESSCKEAMGNRNEGLRAASLPLLHSSG